MKMNISDFMIRFLLCNLWISGMIGFLFLVKGIFQNRLTSRMHYHLWHLLLGLLAVPFLPLRPVGFIQIASWIGELPPSLRSRENIPPTTSSDIPATAGQINDFALSVARETPSPIVLGLFGIWIAGILLMTISLVQSARRLAAIRKSALPLQNQEIHLLYRKCIDKMKIKRDIPIYSTAFLKSPAITGVFRPCIYLPIHLISEGNIKDMGYILLHELQHYRHHDALANHPMNIARVVYWFHPLVQIALREMRHDREIACDTSVLNMLRECDYTAYGNTLIRFAEKTSQPSFPIAAGISGNMRQMQKRIANVATYKTPSVWKRLKSGALFLIITVILVNLSPALSTYGADQNHYQWNTSSEKISSVDSSSYFNDYEGSFVLYSLKDNAWSICDMEHATLRTSPDSTYKIYDALFALEEGIIDPRQSTMAWDGTDYPFEAWNRNQTLESAMESSVNWYFQKIDRQLGSSVLKDHIRQMNYGNETIAADLSTYWMQSALKISPAEQVILLKKVFTGEMNYSAENIHAVKDSIHISSVPEGKLYGKTGTGRVDGKEVNGWFVGMVETPDNTHFFACNIQSPEHATGSMASEISLSILNDMGIWK